MCAPLNFMFSFTYILVITFDDYSSPFFLGHIELWIFTYCDDWVCLPSLMLPLNSESITRPWWPAPKPDFPRGVRLSGCSTGRSRASKGSSWTLLNLQNNRMRSIALGWLFLPTFFSCSKKVGWTKADAARDTVRIAYKWRSHKTQHLPSPNTIK